jgi:hypothetical protein
VERRWVICESGLTLFPQGDGAEEFWQTSLEASPNRGSAWAEAATTHQPGRRRQPSVRPTPESPRLQELFVLSPSVSHKLPTARRP